MAQLRDIRRRITSIKKTQQVTRAMKMVAAAKLRKAQQSIMEARPYAYKLNELISALLLSPELPPHPLLKQPSGTGVHLFVIAGDRGLCGSFNSNVFKEAESFAAKHPDNLQLTVVGKKGIEFFKKRGYSIANEVKNLDKLSLISLSQEIASDLVDRFLKGECSRIAMTYTEFKSALSQSVVTEWLLPFSFNEPENQEQFLDYIYYPSPEEILKLLLPRFLNSQIHRCLLESLTSVLGARMSAMDMATRNAQDMISGLTLQYNRARQAAITTELIEVISGADALSG